MKKANGLIRNKNRSVFRRAEIAFRRRRFNAEERFNEPRTNEHAGRHGSKRYFDQGVQIHRDSNGEADSIRGTPIGEVDIIIWLINRAISGPFHAPGSRSRVFPRGCRFVLWGAR